MRPPNSFELIQQIKLLIRATGFIIQSEVSKKEKDKYHTLMDIYIYMESRKMVLMILFAEQQRRHKEKRLLDTVGEVKGGMM